MVRRFRKGNSRCQKRKKFFKEINYEKQKTARNESELN